MTVRPLLMPDGPAVYPWAEIGIGDTRTPTGLAQWDVARWDHPEARWASSDPYWLDRACEVVDAETDAGRGRIIDRFRPGTSTITVRNTTGWADMSVGDPALLELRPGRHIRWGVDLPSGRVVMFHGYVDDVVPVYDPYGLDTVELACVDALSDAGRTVLDALDTPVGAERVDARITRTLDLAGWSKKYRDIQPGATMLQASTMAGQVYDQVGRAADSNGGAVFGDLKGRVAFRPRDWQTYDPATPPAYTIGNVAAGDICPAEWELSWRRTESATVVRVGRSTTDLVTVRDAVGVAMIGEEPFSRLDLIPTDNATLSTIAYRILDTRGVASMPRVDAVVLDAGTDPGDGRVVEVMARARPETATRIRCRLRTRDGRNVFDVQMLVTGCRHQIVDGRWTCRLELDAADPFAVTNTRWDTARWDQARWTIAV